MSKDNKKNGHAIHEPSPSEDAVKATDDLSDVALPSASPLNEKHDGAQWSINETLRGKRILVTGTTGFLGKVLASMLLRYHPDIEQLYLVIRDRRHQSAESRFFEEVADSPSFDPLREIYGPEGVLEFFKEKVTVLGGDISQPNLGMEPDEARAISSVLDVFVNSAGLTNFNPNLENALRINTLSAKHILDFIRLGGSRAKVLHVSTAFVAGSTQKPTAELTPTPEVYPRFDEIGLPLDAVREVEDCLAMIEHAKVLAKDQERQTTFARAARDWMTENNRDPHDEKAFAEAFENERRAWIKRHLSDEGQKRAAHWGWVNIYTYTKSLGERLYVETAGEIDYALFRPAIIESALSYPMPGWNEGINTTAPICYLVYKGHRFLPCRDDVRLDVVPIDMVTGPMIALMAGLLENRTETVYHCGSSDLNPMPMHRIVELTSLGARQLIDREVGTSRLKKIAMKSLDAVSVSPETFNRQSLPGFGRAAKKLGSAIDGLPTNQLGGIGKALKAVRKTSRRIEKLSKTGEKIFELFMPFIHDNKYTFRARNIGKLTASLSEAEQALYALNIADLDWRHYWLDVHYPGLAKWSFPSLEAKLQADTREAYTYDDLVQLFDSSTRNYADRVAFQHHDRGRIVEQYTYGELHDYAERASNFMQGIGVGPGVSVLLVAENRPQWGMTYFGILKAGGIAVPVDSESNEEQIANLAASCRARAVVVSAAVKERLGEELDEVIAERELPLRVLTFEQLFTLALGAETEADEAQTEDVPRTFDTVDNNVASLIYTSGTTGDPKGVMLSHENFTSMLSSLDRTFRVNTSDGFLSVLPLHHTFEFSCGFLMPLSKGATVTYMEDLSGDELRSAMSSTRVTALIGVPALWQLLHRSIKQKVDGAGPAARLFFDNMLALNKALRERTGINAGPLMFGAVHQVFGNKIRYLISGGAALPEDTLEAFHGLGFDMYEGYGLTEAAPVLTVNRPRGRLIAGSVGEPVPGVEVKIHEPDENGVGEVIARGDNIMLGYLDREEDTSRALKDGWLHTGDLGTIDDRGRLAIVGRSKEVIVTSGGKNAYPDELEEIYGRCPGIEELAVVGIDDGHDAERIACLIRTIIDEGDTDMDLAERRAEIRDWIRIEGHRVAAHNRLQVIRFWDEEFPRTATRKVKRREVVEILERLLSAEAEAIESDGVEHAWTWLEKTVATLADVDPSRVHSGTHFVDDLAFDSLMFVELASILEARELHISADHLSDLRTLNELQSVLDDPSAAGAMVRTKSSTMERVDEFPVHPTLSQLGKDLLHGAQMRAYGDIFNVKVFGESNIPWHNPNVIVVANHASHLDMGLVKYALGDFGKNIRALAAADYFFKNPMRKTYFNNFTNLIPVERSGSPEVALKGAVDSLNRGEMLLMFPEGTRATDGKLRSFRRGLGYLVASEKVDILPVYVEGTYRALPKGQSLPSPTNRNLKVRIGELLSARQILRKAQDKTGTELWDIVSQEAYEAVKYLRDAYDTRNADSDEELEPLFAELTDMFERDQVDDKVSYYFSLGNIDDHKWTVVVDAEDCTVHMGKPHGGQADCVVKTTPDIFRKIVQEAYVPSFDEFMDGTIKTNSPDLLMRFQSVFRLQG